MKSASFARYVFALLLILLAFGGTSIASAHTIPIGAGKITEFNTPGQPFGITRGPGNDLWFTEYYANRIGRITSTGKITQFRLPKSGCCPLSITMGPDGNLWFTENGNWGSYGTSDYIGRITPTGQTTLYPLPNNQNQDLYPWGITTGPDGNLWFTVYMNYVEEDWTDYIGMISPGAGSKVTLYPLPNGFSHPFYITSGPDGDLWFAEGGNSTHGIGKINPYTHMITEYPVGTSKPVGIAIGPGSDIWFTDFAGSIDRFDLMTRHTTRFPLPNGGYPFDIAMGPDGRSLVH